MASRKTTTKRTRSQAEGVAAPVDRDCSAAVFAGILLVPCDARVRRIAAALAEGCDGRSSASSDAKWLHRRYEEWKTTDPAAGFSECRERAFADFIVGVLGHHI